MVFLLDVNLVLALHREDHTQHAPAVRFLDQLLEDGRDFTVPAVVLTALLRLATNRRVFPVPSARSDVFAFIDALRAQPQHLQLEPGARHLTLLRAACDEADATADLIPDAVIAAVATEHRCEVVTFDRDFARFPSVPHTLLDTA